jgi:hypothetical protein
MRRFAGSALLTVAGLLLLAGCAAPAGVDGNLVNGWPAMPAAAVAVPATGACYNTAGVNPDRVTRWLDPVACTAPHSVETVHVGAFTGAAAGREQVPAGSDEARRTAYGECGKATADFLGGDWRTGRLGLFLDVPSQRQWSGGARWYRCDLVQYERIDVDPAQRSSSLKGGLTGDRPEALGCTEIDVASGAVKSMAAAACGTAHNAEFAGIFEGPAGPYPTDDSGLFAGCQAKIGEFVGITDGTVRNRVDVVTAAFGRVDWDLGNRGVRCYLHVEGKTFARTLKGAGPGVLPAG